MSRWDPPLCRKRMQVAGRCSTAASLPKSLSSYMHFAASAWYNYNVHDAWSEQVSHYLTISKSRIKMPIKVGFESYLSVKCVLNILCAIWLVTSSVTVLEATIWVKSVNDKNSKSLKVEKRWDVKKFIHKFQSTGRSRIVLHRTLRQMMQVRIADVTHILSLTRQRCMRAVIDVTNWVAQRILNADCFFDIFIYRKNRNHNGRLQCDIVRF